MVETPDRIMTTGGWDSGGSGMWILLLAFLFMFRGGGFGGDGHRDGNHGGGCGDNYKRYDADFRELRRDDWELQKEGLIGRYESRIANLECCCKTNGNIGEVKCEVKEQGEKTRALMIELELKEALARKDAEIAAMGLKLNRIETVNETVAALRGHGCYPFGGHGGFIPAPAGYRYEGYAPGTPEGRGGCPHSI